MVETFTNLHMMLIHEIHVFELRIEMNFQCMIFEVINAARVVADRRPTRSWSLYYVGRALVSSTHIMTPSLLPASAKVARITGRIMH